MPVYAATATAPSKNDEPSGAGRPYDLTDSMIMLLAGMNPDDRRALAVLLDAVEDALSVLPSDERRTLVRNLRDVQQLLSPCFTGEES